MLTWYGYIYRNKIIGYNIFDNIKFLQCCKDSANKYKNDREQFEISIKKDLMFCYWGKTEWEIVVNSWPCHENTGTKISVFDQVMLNWERFADYVWDNIDLLSNL